MTSDWVNRTSSPAKRRARQIAEIAALMAGAFVVVFAVGSLCLWVWEAPRTAVPFVVVGVLAIFLSWLFQDDPEGSQ